MCHRDVAAMCRQRRIIERPVSSHQTICACSHLNAVPDGRLTVAGVLLQRSRVGRAPLQGPAQTSCPAAVSAGAYRHNAGCSYTGLRDKATRLDIEVLQGQRFAVRWQMPMHRLYLRPV